MMIILWPAKEWLTRERWCHISKPSLMWALHHRHDHHDHLHLHHRHHDHHQKIFIFFDKMIIVMIVKLPIFTKIWLTQVGTDSEGEIDEIFFIWPTTLVRRISFNIFFKYIFLCRCTRSTARARSTAWAREISWKSVTRLLFFLKGWSSKREIQSRWRFWNFNNIDHQEIPPQARSSYLPNEVLWGYRFVNLLNFKHSESEYKIDYSAFNSVYRWQTFFEL